eukprot:904385-Pyramimonas_sp.AAC.2
MARAPAMTLLHLGEDRASVCILGPGLANALANLHNAKRAGSPVLNVVGEMASWHRHADAPLAMDIEALAATVSGYGGRNIRNNQNVVHAPPECNMT